MSPASPDAGLFLFFKLVLACKELIASRGMGFIFTLKETGNAGRLLFGNREFLARVPIGYDMASGIVYSIFAALSPEPGGGNSFEFIFNVIAADPQEGDITEHWDGSETKAFLVSGEQRSLVFRELCEMLRALIDAAQPQRLIMITHESGLPKKALVKFQKLAIVMRDCGFDARKVDPMHGQHMWIAIR